jgi:hypothetical protein
MNLKGLRNPGSSTVCFAEYDLLFMPYAPFIICLYK